MLLVLLVVIWGVGGGGGTGVEAGPGNVIAEITVKNYSGRDVRFSD